MSDQAESSSSGKPQQKRKLQHEQGDTDCTNDPKTVRLDSQLGSTMSGLENIASNHNSAVSMSASRISGTGDDTVQFASAQQAFICRAIRPEIHEWKAYNSENITNREVPSRDIFEVLPFDRQYLRKEVFVDKLLRIVTPWRPEEEDARQKFIKCKQNLDEVMEIIKNFMRFTVKVHSTLTQFHAELPEFQRYGLYPNLYHYDATEEEKNLCRDMILDMQQSHKSIMREEEEVCIEESQTKAMRKHACNKLVHLRKARDFIEETLQFLAQQENLTEAGCKRLFTSFCAVAGLTFRDVGSIECRMQTFCGVGLKSKEDYLRAVVDVLPRLDQTPDSNWGVLWTNHTVSVTALAQVKQSESKRVPSNHTRPSSSGQVQQNYSNSEDEDWLEAETCITEILGELTGHMICQIISGNIYKRQHLIGFVVQCTMVQVVLMHMPFAVQSFLLRRLAESYRGEYGQIYFTSQYDMLDASDREKLWDIISVVAAL